MDERIFKEVDEDSYVVRPCHKCCKEKAFDECAGRLMMCSLCSKWYFDNELIAHPIDEWKRLRAESGSKGPAVVAD